MLLVTFHGGSGVSGINNVSAYSTSGDSYSTLLTAQALDTPESVTLSELRAMFLANNMLYVANGAKSQSTVLAFALPAPPASTFAYASTLIGPTLSSTKDHFKTSIAHPFGIVFEDEATCFVSNQDTNVVSGVTVGPGGLGGSLGHGCHSDYLKKKYPKGSFLDGTYVASQVGQLPDIDSHDIPTDVDADFGGLGVSFEHKKVKNSVRDVAIANGVLFVCDEPDKVVSLDALADGRYIGKSIALPEGPTHLAINDGGLYISAGSNLYWGQLPQSSSPSLSLQAITPLPSSRDEVKHDTVKIGGIAFDGASTVYIPYQTGTGGNNPGGSIYRYSVGSQTPPALIDGAAFATSLTDTPEFLLYCSGGA